MPDNSYLIFRPDENGQYPERSTEIYSGPPPHIGLNIPIGALALVWVPVDGDVNPDHYLRSNLNLIHCP